MFFSFDGIDGAGKSTQMDLFCDWLENEKGKKVVRCREPGGTPTGEEIRELLLNKKHLRLDIEAELFLFMASRAQLVSEIIQPAISQNQIVVCDRFQLASVVYQGHAGGLDPKVVRTVGRIAIGETVPDLTFVFLLDPAIAAERVGDQTDRIESRQDNFLNRVAKGFEVEIARGEFNCAAIDASRKIDVIQAEIRRMAAPILLKQATTLS